MEAVSGRFGSGVVEVTRGDLVEERADAIVNAANGQLTGGGGVDAALHKAAGPSLLEECLSFTSTPEGVRCPIGEVRVTHAGDLHAKYVIHAVGPVFDPDERIRCESELHQVHLSALRAAAHRQCETVALPAICAGAYGFPAQLCGNTAIRATAEFLNGGGLLKRVRFVLFNDDVHGSFVDALRAQLRQA